MAKINYNRPFAWQPINFKSVADFREFVAINDISWAKGATLHHTWRPTRAQWHGMATMNGMKKTFLENEEGTWDSGPNLFIAPDGIWQGTPITRSGIHAGKCNKDHLGIEIVGDYDVEPWPAQVQAVVFGVVDVILDKLDLDVTTESVNGHRECLHNKTCPGKMIDLDEVRHAIAIYRGSDIVPVPGPESPFAVDARIYGAWEASGGVWNAPGILTPGLPLSSAYHAAIEDPDVYQRFERAVARWKTNGTVEWLLLSEMEA